MKDIEIARATHDGVVRVGKIIRSSDFPLFRYSEEYLSNKCALPLSQSLPCRDMPYGEDEFRPYFEGLLAEGPTRDALASELGVKGSDYLSVLALCGRDCIGDVLAWDDERFAPEYAGGVQLKTLVSEDTLRALFRGLSEMSEENAESRLSLAGNQNKIGLRREDDAWWRPSGLAATTHILKTSNLRDIPEIEFLCMKAARVCGMVAADVELLDYGRPVLAVERFDRSVDVDESGAMRVNRLHQEDFAQAFRVLPARKYIELDGGSVASIARLIRFHSANPITGISEFGRALCFNYAIGNCDAHLKNYSLVSNGSRRGSVVLAPAYDLVSTTYYPRFDRDLAMNYGEVRNIDEIDVACFVDVAHDLGMSTAALASLAKPIVENLDAAVRDAGNGEYGSALETTPYVADNLRDDMVERLETLGAFVERYAA